MARKNRALARTALALAATTVAEAVVQKLADDPKFRRKVKAKAKTALGTTQKALKRSGKKIVQAVKKRRKSKAAPKRAARRKKSSASRR
jgi:hypothetical protein